MVIWLMNRIFAYLRKKFASAPVDPIQSPKSSAKNVLVIDDDVAFCRIIQRSLSEEQHKVHISHSVADALAAIEQKPFDAYVMDYKLADGSGFDVAERIRSKGSEAPIILISGCDTSSVASRAEKFNVFVFLQKPFSREILSEAVKKAIGAPKAASALSPADPAVSPMMSAPTRTRFWQRPAKRRAS
jgi:two-component system, NtrC family, response regulator HydG